MSTMTDMFYIVMQQGLESGPYYQPRALYTITRAPRSGIMMLSLKGRSESEEWAKPLVDRSLKIEKHYDSIVRFQEIMAECPTQYCGVEDLYGQNTSIVQVTEHKLMPDLYLSGDKAPKVPRPTEEQKAMFREAVAIVENWGAISGPK